MTVGARSEGAVLLLAVDKTNEELADDLEVSKALVGHWKTGRRTPAGKSRRKLEQLHGIPRASWDKPHRPKANGETKVKTNASLSTLEIAQRLRASASEQLIEAANLPPVERGRIERHVRDTIRMVSSITGEGLTIDEKKILKTPAWARLEAAILKVLEPHPKLMRELGEALAELGKEIT